ncbi:MAG: DUF2802 domain-containing protein [Betaproteobacteria bacterium]|nr:DUF2802 domain-containing protein [Betaproteobacteria bacterium]
MGVREIVIGAIVLLGGYITYVLVRVALLSREGKRPVIESVPEYQTILGGGATSHAAPVSRPELESVPEPEEEDEGEEPVRNPAADVRDSFDARVEVARLRFQIEALENSLAQQKQDLETLRGELDTLRNARAVAPQYGEAVALAQRGLDTNAIAERCGISVSEAELVAALSRGAGHQE